MKNLIDLDTIFIFTLIVLSSLENIDIIARIPLCIAGTIFAILKSIEIILNWIKKRKKTITTILNVDG